MREATIHLTRSILSASSLLRDSRSISTLKIQLRSNSRLTSSTSHALSVSMAAAQAATATVNAADQDKFGFKRPDMYKESLTGTIAAYDRHVFLCYKGPDSWGPRVESSAPLPLLPAFLFAFFKARKNDMSLKTNLTVCGPASGDDLSDGDVLIFPDMIRYRGLQEADVDSFVEDVLVNNMNWSARPPESFSGTYVFVCAHGSRDKRCGVCGPVLIDSFNEEIVSRQLTDEVHISSCSHIGGHKYAGNLIIFNPDRSGKVTGHWYGYVTPEDVPEMLDSHIKMGKIIQRMWSKFQLHGPNGAGCKEAGGWRCFWGYKQQPKDWWLLSKC